MLSAERNSCGLFPCVITHHKIVWSLGNTICWPILILMKFGRHFNHSIGKLCTRIEHERYFCCLFLWIKYIARSYIITHHKIVWSLGNTICWPILIFMKFRRLFNNSSVKLRTRIKCEREFFCLFLWLKDIARFFYCLFLWHDRIIWITDMNEILILADIKIACCCWIESLRW